MTRRPPRHLPRPVQLTRPSVSPRILSMTQPSSALPEAGYEGLSWPIEDGWE